MWVRSVRVHHRMPGIGNDRWGRMVRSRTRWWVDGPMSTPRTALEESRLVGMLVVKVSD